MDSAISTAFNGVVTTMTSAAGDLVSGGLGAISAILPVVMPFMAAMIAIGLCIGLIRRIVG